jgi:CheY-like chemotaxis protein
MGERILSDEGYEVVAVTNADSALIRMEDVDPDVVLADAVMPGRGGFEICQYLKMSPRHRRIRVILTAGAQEPFDEARAAQVQADAVLKKPFEASVLLAVVKPLAEAAARERGQGPAGFRASAAPGGAGIQPAGRGQGLETAPSAPFVAVVDAEQVRAAVTVALDAAMENMVSEIAARVVSALQTKPSVPPAPPKVGQTLSPANGDVQAFSPATGENVRRVTSLRRRSGSILGLDAMPPPDPE